MLHTLKQLCGNGDAPQTWFVVHVVMVVTGVLLSIIGVALVIGEKGTDPLKVWRTIRWPSIGGLQQTFLHPTRWPPTVYLKKKPAILSMVKRAAGVIHLARTQHMLG